MKRSGRRWEKMVKNENGARHRSGDKCGNTGVLRKERIKKITFILPEIKPDHYLVGPYFIKQFWLATGFTDFGDFLNAAFPCLLSSDIIRFNNKVVN
jgi:hypothetical protein